MRRALLYNAREKKQITWAQEQKLMLQREQQKMRIKLLRDRKMIVLW